MATTISSIAVRVDDLDSKLSFGYALLLRVAAN